MYTTTYFRKNQDIPQIEYVCRNEHKQYIEIPYNDSSLFTKVKRKLYVEHINKWLNSPVIDINGIVYLNNEKKINRNTQEGDEWVDYDKLFNNLQYDTLSRDDYGYNDDIDTDTDTYDNYDTLPMNNNYNEYILYNNYQQQQDNQNNKNYLKIATICESFYDDILECVNNSGYTINDINQFKEDLIHYIYMLSDIDNFIEDERL